MIVLCKNFFKFFSDSKDFVSELFIDINVFASILINESLSFDTLLIHSFLLSFVFVEMESNDLSLIESFLNLITNNDVLTTILAARCVLISMRIHTQIPVITAKGKVTGLIFFYTTLRIFAPTQRDHLKGDNKKENVPGVVVNEVDN